MHEQTCSEAISNIVFMYFAIYKFTFNRWTLLYRELFSFSIWHRNDRDFRQQLPKKIRLSHTQHYYAENWWLQKCIPRAHL